MSDVACEPYVGDLVLLTLRQKQSVDSWIKREFFNNRVETKPFNKWMIKTSVLKGSKCSDYEYVWIISLLYVSFFLFYHYISVTWTCCPTRIQKNWHIEWCCHVGFQPAPSRCALWDLLCHWQWVHHLNGTMHLSNALARKMLSKHFFHTPVRVTLTFIWPTSHLLASGIITPPSFFFLISPAHAFFAVTDALTGDWFSFTSLTHTVYIPPFCGKY